jgi:hypothetical protein
MRLPHRERQSRAMLLLGASWWWDAPLAAFAITARIIRERREA